VTFSATAVVTLVPAHLRFLPKLLINLRDSRPQFTEVFVVASGLSRAARHHVRRMTQDAIGARGHVIFTDLRSAGFNRNRGWEKASGTLVGFFDCDDFYLLRRNEVVNLAFTNTNFDLFLNSFSTFLDGEEEPNLRRPLGGLEEELAFEIPSLSTIAGRQRELELRGQTDSTNLRFANPHDEFPLHHAHSFIKTSWREKVRFHEVHGVRNEDGVIAQDILESGGVVAVSRLQLTFYRQGARAKPKKSPFQSLLGGIGQTTIRRKSAPLRDHQW